MKMKMKMVMIAALAAAQLPAGAARAADLPGEELVGQQRAASAGARLREDVELDPGDRRAPEPGVGSASASSRAEVAQEEDEPRKKRKSTGDKVLTGAAVVLGIGALAVGGLLVAIFVN